MASAPDARLERVRQDPEFHDLVARRSRFAWTLSALMAAIYFGFILLIAFVPSLLAMPLGDGVTTLGIPVGLGVILAAFVLTGLYVRRANTTFDEMTKRIVERAQ